MSAARKHRAPVSDARRAAIAKVKIAQKELGLDDDTYRDVLEAVTGKRSAADCTDAQLARVLEHFASKGFKAKSSTKGAADHPAAKKARALWISLHQLGAVRDPSERALEAFARRQLGCARLQWADQGLTYKLIEALKAMAERSGWSQADREDDEPVVVLKRSLIRAQARKLGEDAPILFGLVEADLDAIIQALAVRIRLPKGA
jgi:phage gp16-like protein